MNLQEKPVAIPTSNLKSQNAIASWGGSGKNGLGGGFLHPLARTRNDRKEGGMTESGSLPLFHSQGLAILKRRCTFAKEELEIEGVIGKGVALLSP